MSIIDETPYNMQGVFILRSLWIHASPSARALWRVVQFLYHLPRCVFVTVCNSQFSLCRCNVNLNFLFLVNACFILAFAPTVLYFHGVRTSQTFRACPGRDFAQLTAAASHRLGCLFQRIATPPESFGHSARYKESSHSRPPSLPRPVSCVRIKARLWLFVVSQLLHFQVLSGLRSFSINPLTGCVWSVCWLVSVSRLAENF